MSRIEFDWPDEGAERVRAAEGRLRLAGEELARRPFEARLAVVAAVLDDWTRPDSPYRRELAAALAEATPFTAATIKEGLDSALRAWRPADFIACAEREIGGTTNAGRCSLVPFEWTTVIAGGALPMPTMLSGLLPLVLGSPVLLRETSKDPVTARLLARSIARRDEALAAAFEPIAFPSDDTMALEAALAAPCVVATGSDETLASISSRLSPTQRFVGYGHRFSIAILGTTLDDDARMETAAGLALDVSRWDQSGCLSPVVAYLVGWEREAQRHFASLLDDELRRVSADLPRGEIELDRSISIAHERSEARMRAAMGGMLFEGSDHTVVLETDARPRPAPLGRFIRLLPVESPAALIRSLEPFAGHLSNVCFAGFREEDERGEIEDAPREDAALPPIEAPSAASPIPPREAPSAASPIPPAWARLGVSRFTRPGRLQTPPIDWPHDGLPLFVPLARFTNEDLDRPTIKVD